MSLHLSPLSATPDAVAFRKFIDLIQQASSKRVNWDPLIDIRVGHYGAINSETGKLEVEGNVYDACFQQSLRQQGLGINLTDPSYQPIKGAIEDDIIISSVCVKQGESLGSGKPEVLFLDLSVKADFQFLEGMRGAILAMRKPQQEYIPQGRFLNVIFEANQLKDKYLVTSTCMCPAYCCYLSDQFGEKVTLAFVTSGGAPSGWWTDGQASFLRTERDKAGRYLYTPLYSLECRTSWFQRLRAHTGIGSYRISSLQSHEGGNNANFYPSLKYLQSNAITQPHTHPALRLSSSSLSETTATEGPASASDEAPQDLTNQLQRRSRFPIASGGFGDIWKCCLVERSGTVQVAVKSIRSFELDSDAVRRKKAKRVRRELKVWGRLRHDSILPLWGVANNFGHYPAMVCPWADNGALTGYLERQHDLLSFQDKFSLLRDIALGLHYLHSKTIVHGDLSGANVLIYGNGRACLADFGLSTIILEFNGTSYFTESIRGSIRWAAAELFEAPEDNEDDEDASVSLGVECDIYSFGSIMLQVLTCKVPYYNLKKDDLVLGQVIRGKKPEPPRESRIEPVHWEFIQQCWLPRASRPSVAEVVTFVGRELQALLS